MLYILPHWVTLTLTLAVVTLALARGGRSERLVAVLTLCNIVWAQTHPAVYGERESVDLVHDTGAAVIMTLIALRSNRWWTLAAASVWWIATATEVAQLIAPVGPWAYGTAELVWWWLFLACLAAGALRRRGPQLGFTEVTGA
jgi:hypothetical protein